MNRIFVREQSDEEYAVTRNKYKIGVAGIGAGVGTSLIATSIAKEYSKDKAKRTAFVEVSDNSNEKTYLYDSIGMDKRFAGKLFYNFYEEIAAGRNISRMINLDERINWALRLPHEVEKKSMELIELCRLINNITGDMIICDISNITLMDSVIKEMDAMIVVIDPLPSKLIVSYNQLCYMKKCQLSGQPVIWVVNKYNEGINNREFNSFVKLRKFIKIPYISLEYFYLAEYNCKLPYNVKNVSEVLKEPILQILHNLNT